VLDAGGDAVDAAVATAFTLAVTLPDAGNLGGGGFMTLWIKGKPYFLDYREAAPGRASADMYLDASGKVTPGLSLVGNLAVGTPGTVMGLWEAHQRFGKLPWARDLAPAIRLAREGFVVPEQLSGFEQGAKARFANTNFDRYFGAMQANARFRQPELADTLTRIAEGGAKAFYQGRTAELIVAQMARGERKGLITLDDLARYRAVWREPLVGRWRDMTVITAPPPSSGGIGLLQLLTMKADDARLFGDAQPNSAEYVHLVSELEKRVFADRADYLGDPDFTRVPVQRLLDPAYLARRAAEVDPNRPSPTAAVKPGLDKLETTHFSIVDRWGDAVSSTYTLNGLFGAGVVVEGAGFLLNDEMDDFSAKPGAPNMFGVIGGAANAIAPYKRPLSSMTPTILLDGDQTVAMVVGSPGGSRIFTTVFQVIEDVWDYGLPLEAAVAAPRFHHQLLPEDTIYLERRFPLAPTVMDDLARRGWRFAWQQSNGEVQAVLVRGGVPVAASDPRGHGVSLIVR
jgi:gamma-glutamyltranspeptidase / glutathione hydrolase